MSVFILICLFFFVYYYCTYNCRYLFINIYLHIIMDWDLLATVLITAITVLGSSEAFKYYKSKLALKSKSMDLREEYKEDLQKRVNRLEVLLEDSSKEKDVMRLDVIKLTEEVATLRERVKFLEAENERLKKI